MGNSRQGPRVETEKCEKAEFKKKGTNAMGREDQRRWCRKTIGDAFTRAGGEKRIRQEGQNKLLWGKCSFELSKTTTREQEICTMHASPRRGGLRMPSNWFKELKSQEPGATRTKISIRKKRTTLREDTIRRGMAGTKRITVENRGGLQAIILETCGETLGKHGIANCKTHGGNYGC